MYRGLFAGLAMLICATSLSAQITTYVAPPSQSAPTKQAVAAADSIRKDSVARVSMRNMKEWVDSAAGVSVPAYDATAPVPAPLDSTVVVRQDTAGRSVMTTFSNGSVAPETASDLPALLVFGIVGLVAGAALLANRQRG